MFAVSFGRINSEKWLESTSAQEIRKIHISDVEQLCEATRRKLVLVTADKRTFLADISEMKHTGIIILTKNVAIPEISCASQAITNLLNRYTADEFLNAVFYVNH